MEPELRFCLLGRDIAYSRSPELFRILFDSDGIEGSFTLFDVSPDDLPEKMEEIRQIYGGAAVTVPYKKQVRALLDSETKEAKAIGAVNSVKVTKGKLEGGNTDWIGFRDSLEFADSKISDILLLGAGGAARAVLFALAYSFPGCRITVSSRKAEANRSLVDEMNSAVTGATLSAGNNISPRARYDLIINATPLGGVAHEQESPIPGDFEFEGQPVCYDLVYKPAESRFLRIAAEHGCTAKNGLEMLARQGIASYEWWTGRTPDRQAVVEAFLDIKAGYD